ncbi:MAG: hypothetical protein ABI780_10630 [Ardenticatenales bacterium]
MDTPRQTTEAPSAQHRRPARWAAAALALSFLAASCGAPDRSGAPSGAAADDATGAQAGYDRDARAAAAAGVRLTLTIDPQVGDAPLTVRVHATLDGDLDDPARYQCATAAFAFGDDNVQLVPPPEDCVDGVQRTYDTEHVYAAGSFRASVRLIARPVEASKPVQVLVRGATPTAVPMAANPGPTIVIATPGLAFPADATPAPHRTAVPAEPAEPAEQAATRTTAAPTARATRLAQAPTAVAVATIVPPLAPTAMAPSAPPSPTPGARAMLAVLPADLYYLGGSPTRLWRLPATGDEPEAIDGPTESTDRFAVSTIGFIARQQRGMISVLSPTGGRRTLVEPMDDSGDGRADRAGPVWSRDGHLLAYSVDGRLKIFDVVTFEEREVGVSDGAPMGFSRDSRWLLMALDNGRIGWVDVESGDERVIPLPDGSGQPAGWLPDRNVLWSSGAGLRFVTLDDPLTITPVIEPTTRVSKVLVRSDHRALALVDRGAGSVMAVIDLQAPTVTADVVGAPLDVAVDADLAWAPDGRTLAVAGSDGLALVDPATGARVPLIGGPTSAPVWMLSGRRSPGGDGG